MVALFGQRFRLCLTWLDGGGGKWRRDTGEETKGDNEEDSVQLFYPTERAWRNRRFEYILKIFTIKQLLRINL